MYDVHLVYLDPPSRGKMEWLREYLASPSTFHSHMGITCSPLGWQYLALHSTLGVLL